MSEVFYTEISIDDLIRQSSTILVVKKTKPFITTKNIKIGDKYPDFTEITMHYEIVEILKTDKNLVKGQSVLVYPANQDNEFYLHKEYYIHHMGESPIYTRYTNYDNIYYSPENESPDEIIIFLNVYNESYFQLSVINAFEYIKYKNKITGLIK